MILTNAFLYDCIALTIAAGDTVKLAFYSAGSVSATTLIYTPTGEQTQTTVIPAGGLTLAGRTLSADGAAPATLDWSNVTGITPSGSNITFQIVMAYNATRGNRTIFVHDYGSTQTLTAGQTYQIVLPAAGSAVVSLRAA